MIQFENTHVDGFEAAIRGARNPLNSWAKSDSYWTSIINADTGEAVRHTFVIGEQDAGLMARLRAAGSDEGKCLRMIHVQVDITAPTFLWQQIDTYKVATVRDSCSKMHRIQSAEIVPEMFAHEGIDECGAQFQSAFRAAVAACERLRGLFNETHEKRYWRALIEMLPEGYMMRSTMDFNYETIRAMYHARKHHKLDEWHEFCRWAETLPLADELIVGTK